MYSNGMKVMLAALLGIAVVFGVFGVVGADDHLPGHPLIQGKGDGKHKLMSKNGTVAHAHVVNGKVRGVSATHAKVAREMLNGTRPGPGHHKQLKITKYWSKKIPAKTKRSAVGTDADDVVHLVAELDDSLAGQRGGYGYGYGPPSCYVGFGFTCPYTQVVIIYWFQVNVVYGGTYGCIPYPGDYGNSGYPNGGYPNGGYPNGGYPNGGGYPDGGDGGYGGSSDW